VLAAYAYDGLGRRIQETANGITTDLYYDQQGNVLEEDVGGVAKVQYVYSPADGSLIERDRDATGNGQLSERLYAQTDANGDVTALVNAAGQVVERYVYDPYGTVTVLDANWNTRAGSQYAWRYLFQGGRYDSATGYYHFGARDYSPSLGSWLEQDPLGLGAGDPNVYRFVGGNPVNATDPSGLFDWQQLVRNGSRRPSIEELLQRLASEPRPAPLVPPLRRPAPLTSLPQGDPLAYALSRGLVHSCLGDPPAGYHRLPPNVAAAYSAEAMALAWESFLDHLVEAGRRLQQGFSVRQGPRVGIGQPGFWDGLIPFYGSGRSAIDHFQNGEVGLGFVNVGLCVADIFIVRSLVVGGGRIGARLLAREAAEEAAGAAERATAQAVAREAAAATSEASNAALAALYRDLLRAQMQRPHVVDQALSRMLDELYRTGATVGSGSTAAAVRVELATGIRVGGRSHLQKARDYIAALQRWLSNNPTARPGDRAAAENVLRDLQNALAGR
jgi:RHS repeat-associated protein